MTSRSRCAHCRLLLPSICCIVLLFVPLGALSAQHDDPSTAPRILLFRVLAAIDEGVQWHEFHWEVANTVRVKLFQDGAELRGRSQQADGSIGWPLSMSGAMRMRLKATATFELVAEGQSGASASKRQVAEVVFRKPPGKKRPQVPPEKSSSPRITSFRVSPAAAEPGQEIGFFWEVESAQSVRLYEGDHEIDLRGFEDNLSTGGVAALRTTIDETTTFRLVASDRARRTTSKSFTVQVASNAEPVATCSVRGRLEGRWRQEVKERPTGPASTWTVTIFVYAAGSDRPVGQASVDSRGNYRVTDLVAGRRYRLEPGWDSVPEEVSVSCDAGQTREGPRIRITGRPHID